MNLLTILDIEGCGREDTGLGRYSELLPPLPLTNYGATKLICPSDSIRGQPGVMVLPVHRGN